jgi:glycosyltransferase involved in cell wall biosynthesis
VNVAILIGRFPPRDVGDAEQQAHRWASFLAARGHRVTVITRRYPGGPPVETRDGFTIVYTPIALTGLFRSLFDLAASLIVYRRIKPRPHFTLAFQTFTSGWISGFIDVFQRIHSVVWVRGENEYRFDRHPELFEPSMFAWRQARRVLVQSVSQREALLAQVRRQDVLRADRMRERMVVIGNGVDLPRVVVEGGTDWLFVGRLVAHKGVGVLLDAIAALPVAARRPLWIVGDGPERAALTAKACALGVNARFEGFKEHEALPGYYARARAILAPSFEGEGLPSTVLEAMAHGLPVLATDLPGVAEAVAEGGRIVPVGDAGALAQSLTAFADPAAHATMARCARAAAEAASWDTLGSRLEQVLGEVAVRSPRVWIVSPNPSSRGGIAAVARQIATSRLSRRFRISMLPTYTPGSTLARIWRGGVGVFQILSMITLRRPDMVHIKVASGGSFVRKLAVGAICRARGVPVLAHVHGGGFDHFLTHSPPLVARLARWWFGGTAQVLTLSDRWAEKLKPIFPNATIEVLPNPIEVKRFDDLAQARFNLPVPALPPPLDSARTAVFLGDLLPRKGVYDLVAAWAEVVREFPGARLVLAGTGERAELKTAVEAAGMSHAVHLPGWVDFDAKRKLLAEADLFVLPSYIEGVPISLLEAMAAGLPSVLTPVGGVLDTVDDGCEVLIVPVGDRAALARAIVHLLGSPEYARQMGESARRRVAQYDIEVYVDKLSGIYDRIIAQGPRRGRKSPEMEEASRR